MAKRVRNNTRFVACWLNPDMKVALDKRAKEVDLTTSSLLRRLIRQYLLTNGQTGQSSPASNVSGGSGERLKTAA
jgi:hypothetical protein